MRVLFVIIAAMAAGSAGWSERPAGSATAQDSGQRPVFRSGTSAVTVDVSVRSRTRRAITGLAASDFTVLDNGVTQQVEQISYGKLPIDVTVGLDVSYSVTGPLLERLRRAVSQLMRDLRRGDRLKLMLFNMRVNRTVDFTTDASQIERALRTVAAGGGTALFDTLSVAMISANHPDRRQLVMFFTDGNDASSTTPPAVLDGIAQRTRATVSFVVLPTVFAIRAPSPRAGVPGSSSNAMTDSTIQRLATDTGGSVFVAAPTGDLGPVFLQALDAFRAAYVLYYLPRGVERGGFHTISVQVNRPGATVQARRGYFGG